MTISQPTDILNLSADELAKAFHEKGIEAYRADQVSQWIYEKGVYDFKKMTNLSLELRKKIAEWFIIAMPETASMERSDDDKSTKFLLKLHDGDLVEAVSMPIDDRHTVCVSSQVGCKFRCAFCASGQNGFFRNLKSGEILAQILKARDAARGKKITHIVFMGIGEPFDNYQNLMKAIRNLNSKHSLNIGARKITVSTCGVIPKIEMLSNEGMQIELSVSLHGATDSVREMIMPVNAAYPVKPLIETCRKYATKTKRAITFEYILIRGVNSSTKDARDLSKLLRGVLCKVNLIPYNPIDEFPHVAPSYEEIVEFQQILQLNGIKTTVRFSKGRDIQAACGQLRSVQLKKS